MDYSKMLNDLIFDELERFGTEGAHRKHNNHDYYAHKNGWTKFLESGSRFTDRALPQKPIEAKIIKKYPAWYIEEQNRNLAETEA